MDSDNDVPIIASPSAAKLLHTATHEDSQQNKGSEPERRTTTSSDPSNPCASPHTHTPGTSSSPPIEYAFPNPFVATASLRARRALNPDHRHVRRPRTTGKERMTGDSGTEASGFASIGGGGGRPAFSVVGPEEGYATDSSYRVRQRLEDNAVIIPSPSSFASQIQQQQRGKRNQPLHREYASVNLRPALRVVEAEMSTMIPRAEDKHSCNPTIGEMSVEKETSIRLEGALSRRGKPLPPRPPPSVAIDPTSENSETRRHRQSGGTFSFHALRQSLPALGAAMRLSTTNRVRSRQHTVAKAYEHSNGPGEYSYAFSTTPHLPLLSQSVHVSSPRSVALEPSPLHTHPSTSARPPHRPQLPTTALKDPADNLNIYLRLARIPKWTRWIDPDIIVDSRWHNTANWGTGRTATVVAPYYSKNPQQDPQSLIQVDPGIINDQNPRSGVPRSGKTSGRTRTIDRLVQSVLTGQPKTTGGVDIDRLHLQQRSQPARPSSAAAAAAVDNPNHRQNLDPGKRESADDRAATGASGRPPRFLKSWQVRQGFLEGIENFYEKNVPYNSIDTGNRWGEQLFAVGADGFHTVRFHDEAALRAEDAGLLGWFTGADFGFHVIPSSLAPRVTTGEQGHHHFERGGRSVDAPTEMPDGCGTLVLVNKRVSNDRALVVIVRPPWLIGTAELKEFAKGALDWRQGSPAYLETRDGQPNLLQAQVYDDCYSNYCFFFCVTNLKHWVFGHFVSRCRYGLSYDWLTFGPVISRKAKRPSVMQILTVWLIRSVDERPRSETIPTRNPPVPHEGSEERPAVAHIPFSPSGGRAYALPLPIHDSGLGFNAGYPYEQGHRQGSQYTGVHSRQFTGPPSINSSNLIAPSYGPSQARPYVGASSTTRPSWYEVASQQRYVSELAGNPSVYSAHHQGFVPLYTPHYQSMSSPPMISPESMHYPITTYAAPDEDNRHRNREKSRRRRGTNG
ncbi:hypothetical protein QFC19_001148 [Naganishia cerealis]|uniref:Uncharacterized protein n=1 Tax=Naganishia cerealis TaxID=610337 RepID=A0ACC2WJ64_9TREE|nr:hypothetical protein QFC19_001148 [Naganishia cerealis]